MTRKFPERPIVCIQGLGFVGSAMAVAVASKKSADGRSAFQVIGVDLPNELGRQRIAALNEGRFPFATEDAVLVAATKAARETGALSATEDPAIYAQADIIVVDVHLDVDFSTTPPTAHFDSFRSALREFGQRIKPGTLVIIETTVPPGTTAQVVAAELAACARVRGLPPDAFLLAHAYERVMPGAHYLDSIVNYWRVYAGHTEEAAEACGHFLSSFINIKDYPLTRLPSTTASEIAKVMENSYRAVNIAFIEEWARFAEAIGVDLFRVIDAIRMRPTHSNMRQPGFGVGGYCLTKDPLFPGIAARDLFGLPEAQFPFSEKAVQINQDMPLVSLNAMSALLGGLAGKRILLLGVTYRQDVADTRFSPSAIFAEAALGAGATLIAHDPLVKEWPEMKLPVQSDAWPAADTVDGVIFCVPHQAYRSIDLAAWLQKAKCLPALLDANNVLSADQRQAVIQTGCAFTSIGRGRAS